MKKEIFKQLGEKYKTERTDELLKKFWSFPEEKRSQIKHNILNNSEIKGDQTAASVWYFIHYEESGTLTDSTMRLKNFE